MLSGILFTTNHVPINSYMSKTEKRKLLQLPDNAYRNNTTQLQIPVTETTETICQAITAFNFFS